MSDWTMHPRNAQELTLQLAGYRITYNSMCMYTLFAPDGGDKWLYYGASLDDAWTSAYKDQMKRGIPPLELLNICKALVIMHEKDEYPSVAFAFKLTELRDWLKENEYIEG